MISVNVVVIIKKQAVNDIVHNIILKVCVEIVATVFCRVNRLVYRGFVLKLHEKS